MPTTPCNPLSTNLPTKRWDSHIPPKSLCMVPHQPHTFATRHPILPDRHRPVVCPSSSSPPSEQHPLPLSRLGNRLIRLRPPRHRVHRRPSPHPNRGPPRGILPLRRLIDCQLRNHPPPQLSQPGQASRTNPLNERKQSAITIIIPHKSPHVPAPPLISTPNLRKLTRWTSS
jgi:hypothetical protein